MILYMAMFNINMWSLIIIQLFKFDLQTIDGELLGDRVKTRDEARYLEKVSTFI